MFRDGIYQVVCCTIGHADRVCDHFVASVRDGRILGSDGHGGLYLGHDGSTAQDYAARIQMTVQIPPDGVLITGLIAGPEGATLPLTGLLDASADRQKSIVNIAGEAVEIEVAYLGPLPR